MCSGMYLLITPNLHGEISGSSIQYLSKEEFTELFRSKQLDKYEFVDHLEFDFDTWNVHVSEGKTPAVLIPDAEALYPFETKTVVTVELNI